MTLPTIIATDENIHRLIKMEIQMQGQNADLNHIDVSNVSNMELLFERHPKFNGRINAWDVRNVKTMIGMFKSSAFVGDIFQWDVGNVEDMSWMFQNSAFSGDLSNWNVSNVKFMIGMFEDSLFNRDISNWNVSNVVSMHRMFAENPVFNHPLNRWDVSNVEDMSCMFEYADYNHSLSEWNTSKLVNAESMFAENRRFNHPVDRWDFSNVKNVTGMFLNTKMHSALPNYLPAAASKKLFIGGVTQSRLFPLSNINEIGDYKTYIAELCGITRVEKPKAYWLKMLRSHPELIPHPGVLALVYQNLDNREIHAQMNDDHRNVLKALFEVSNSVHASVEQWMAQHVLKKTIFNESTVNFEF